MTILYATNDQTDFPGSTISTDTTNFDSNYVSEAFQVSSGGSTSEVQVSWSRLPQASGDVVWFHFQYRKSHGSSTTSADGDVLFELYDTAMVQMFNFGFLNGIVSGNVFGSTTGTANIAGNFSGTTLRTIDVMVDITSPNLTVEVYDGGVLVFTQTVTNNGKLKPSAIRWRVRDISDAAVTDFQYVSEFIVADESTVGMRVTALKPNAAGNYSEWDGDHVETGDTSLATGASSISAGQKLSSVPSAFIAPASTAMRALVVVNKASTRGPTITDLRNFLRISATDYFGASMGVDETITDHVTVWDVNPGTGIDWASIDITGIEVGIESVS
jgi:hypothetical protein